MNALTQLRIDSWISYLIAFAVPAADAIAPVLPGETVVIAFGVATAGSTDPRIGVLVACAALGAFAGDNLCYFIGRRFGAFGQRMVFKGEKGAGRRAWAERSLRRWGMPLIIVCRFVPGGRTAVTLSCGLMEYDRRRFVVATIAAGVIWALYAFLAGRLGGRAFEDKPWVGLVAALAAVTLIGAIIEVVRRFQTWRKGREARKGISR